MKKPGICAVITNRDEKALRGIEPLAELFEVRIDLIGEGWQDIARHLEKPWIACARSSVEGGRWERSEAERTEVLVKASELGCAMVDIEVETGELGKTLLQIKKRTKCLLSFHELKKTPPLNSLREIVKKQLEAGADVCKVITTAESLEDNLTTLKLITGFPKTRVVSFAMGPLGLVSRVLCPLVGGDFTYASIEEGRESAPGQITVRQLRKLYEMVPR
ncbi:MAG: type I 3-dehydroquinate dehydratase [Dehalococcoidales bacterium]|nr:type I 3-dehydroquinate dehydratase [Dehalococcoidales bacterium]